MIALSTIADTLRAVAGKDMAPATSAIIVAAGNSTRMGKGVSKQLLKLSGVPVLARTLHAFDCSGYIDEIIVVTRPEDMSEVAEGIVVEDSVGAVTKPIIQNNFGNDGKISFYKRNARIVYDSGDSYVYRFHNHLGAKESSTHRKGYTKGKREQERYCIHAFEDAFVFSSYSREYFARICYGYHNSACDYCA